MSAIAGKGYILHFFSISSQIQAEMPARTPSGIKYRVYDREDTKTQQAACPDKVEQASRLFSALRKQAGRMLYFLKTCRNSTSFLPALDIKA